MARIQPRASTVQRPPLDGLGPFGAHLALDLELVEVPSLAVATGLVLQGIEGIGMTLLAGPYVYPSARGFSVMAILTESHSSLHIVQCNGGVYAFYDLYSCKTFDASPVLALVRRTLKPAAMYVHPLMERSRGPGGN